MPEDDLIDPQLGDILQRLRLAGLGLPSMGLDPQDAAQWLALAIDQYGREQSATDTADSGDAGDEPLVGNGDPYGPDDSFHPQALDPLWAMAATGPLDDSSGYDPSGEYQDLPGGDTDRWSVDPRYLGDGGLWSADTGNGADCATPGARAKHVSSIGHPGFWESMIPVWGSGREAIADAQEGNYLGAGLNAALAVSDLWPAEDIAKGLAKGGFKLAGSHTWDATRKWLLKQGYRQPGEHGHHWLIPRNGWGRSVPDWIKNQPWNIKALPPWAHYGVHGWKATMPDGVKQTMNTFDRLWYGTPHWAKAVPVSTAGHAVLAGENSNR
jgi:hypothetical protein